MVEYVNLIRAFHDYVNLPEHFKSFNFKVFPFEAYASFFWEDLFYSNLFNDYTQSIFFSDVFDRNKLPVNLTTLKNTTVIIKDSVLLVGDTNLLLLILGIFFDINFLSLSLIIVFYYKRLLTNWMSFTNHLYFSKFFLLVDMEKEFGALDDFLLMFILFIGLFGWYFLVSTLPTLLCAGSLSSIFIYLLLINIFVLFIPTSVLFNYGLFFFCFIRGAGASTNIISNFFFDCISCFVVYIRFIVQNIRFVLIFLAFFELYEYIYFNPISLLLSYLFKFNAVFFSSLNLTFWNTSLLFLGTLLVNFFLYLYYFLHLLILLLVQVGAYFLLSFWLFFFLYTSFFVSSNERYFIYKRYLK